MGLDTAVRRVKRFCVDRPALKRRVKQARYAGIQALSLALGAQRDDAPRMLGYHTVGEGETDLSVSLAQFRQQVDWLLDHGYRILTLAQWWQLMRSGDVPRRGVVLTFDDGFGALWQQAARVLSERGATATVFVVTDYVGRRNSFDRPFLQGPESELLHWHELEHLRDAGWDIQSHGRRHYPMVQLESAALEEEAAGSKAVLERRLGIRVDFFCYPYGALDAQAVEAVARAGYLGAVTCRAGALPSHGAGDRYRLPRSLVDGLMRRGDFSAIFRRGYLRLGAVERWVQQCVGADEEGVFDEMDKLEHISWRREASAT